ncbi:hypothetical protein PG999_002764 [Apiospora kogelbergensis]|uniref:Uncharacterized protein n=1 Tax=Apiospora kogelbergensis TaxID=1337665 RepID=A0AAW0R9A0_9PEZI
MSDYLHNLDFDAVLEIDNHPIAHVPYPATGQANATDGPLEVDGLISPWVFADPLIQPASSQVPNGNHTEGFDSYGTANMAQSAWNTNTGICGSQPVLNQFAAPITQYEGFDFGNLVFDADADGMMPSSNINSSAAGGDLGMPWPNYESPLPANSIWPSFTPDNTLDTTTIFVGQEQTLDESLLQSHAGFNATADQ